MPCITGCPFANPPIFLLHLSHTTNSYEFSSRLHRKLHQISRISLDLVEMPRVKDEVSDITRFLTQKINILRKKGEYSYEEKSVWQWHASFDDKSELDLPDIQVEVSGLDSSIYGRRVLLINLQSNDTYRLYCGELFCRAPGCPRAVSKRIGIF